LLFIKPKGQLISTIEHFQRSQQQDDNSSDTIPAVHQSYENSTTTSSSSTQLSPNNETSSLANATVESITKPHKWLQTILVNNTCPKSPSSSQPTSPTPVLLSPAKQQSKTRAAKKRVRFAIPPAPTSQLQQQSPTTMTSTITSTTNSTSSSTPTSSTSSLILMAVQYAASSIYSFATSVIRDEEYVQQPSDDLETRKKQLQQQQQHTNAVVLASSKQQQNALGAPVNKNSPLLQRDAENEQAGGRSVQTTATIDADKQQKIVQVLKRFIEQYAQWERAFNVALFVTTRLGMWRLRLYLLKLREAFCNYVSLLNSLAVIFNPAKRTQSNYPNYNVTTTQPYNNHLYRY